MTNQLPLTTFDGTMPDKVEADANIAIARRFLAEALKWGKHVVQPFSPLVIRDIVLGYEVKLMEQEKAHEAAIKILEDSHGRYVAELTGKIGGLQKKLNSLEPKK